MGDLSGNFSRSEFACRGVDCCGGSSPVDDRLVTALQEYRDKVGVPVRINSGFRCLTYNRTVGSNDDSRHPKGYAADIGRIDGLTIDEMIGIAESIDAFVNGGIGRYENFIHVDVRPEGRSRWTG